MQRHVERRCPKCGKHIDAVQPMTGGNLPIAAGDATVCTGCFAILMFDERLTLRSPTDLEMCQMKSDAPFWETMQLTIAAVKETFPQPQ